MNSDQNDNDLIEKYLLEKLSGEEVVAVETRMGEDREFARKCRLMKTFPEMMSAEGKLEYDRKFAVVAEQEPERKPFRSPKPKTVTWVGSALILIVIVVLFFVFRTNQPAADSAKWVASPVTDTVNPKPIVASEPEKKSVIPAVDQPVEQAHDAIELINPADGKSFGRTGEIVFSWKQETDSFTRFFICSEIRDKVVLWRGIRPGVREFRVPAANIYPGKFYWFVGTKDVKRTFVVSE